jgi:hypothetical protein
VETGCQGGQGSPRALAPGGWMDGYEKSSYASVYIFSVTKLGLAARAEHVARVGKDKGKIHRRTGHERPRGE